MNRRGTLFVILAALLFPLPLVAAESTADEIRIADEPVTLTWQNREIITFRAEIDGYGPQERVAVALKRFRGLEIGAVAPPVETRPLLGARSVLVFGEPMFVFVEQDLAPGETLDEVGQRAVTQLNVAFAAYVQTHARGFLIKAGTAAAIALGIFLLVLTILWRSSHLILRRLPDPGDRWSQENRFQVRPYAQRALRTTVRLLFVGLELFALYLWLTYVLKLFPYTKPWGDALGDFLLSMLRDLLLGAVRSIPGLTTVIVIFVITRAFVRIVENLFNAVETETVEVSWLQPETANATRRLVVAVMWIFSITVAYPYIPGSNSAAFKGVSVFVGLMVSLGSAGLVNQVMSGLVVVYSRAFKPGEFIRVNDLEGTVSEIGMLSTKVVTKKREEVTIPNAVLVNTMTKNYSSISRETGVILYTSVTIGYDTPWRQVHAMLLLAAERTDGIRRAPKPFVLQTALSDFYAEYQLNVHLEDAQGRAIVLSALHANIQDVFNEFGVQIMSPNFVAQPPEQILTPKEKWYEAPSVPPEEHE